MNQRAMEKLNRILDMKYNDEKMLETKMIDLGERLFNKNLYVDRIFFINKYSIEFIIMYRSMKTYDEMKLILNKNSCEDD